MMLWCCCGYYLVTHDALVLLWLLLGDTGHTVRTEAHAATPSAPDVLVARLCELHGTSTTKMIECDAVHTQIAMEIKDVVHICF